MNESILNWEVGTLTFDAAPDGAWLGSTSIRIYKYGAPNGALQPESIPPKTARNPILISLGAIASWDATIPRRNRAGRDLVRIRRPCNSPRAALQPVLIRSSSSQPISSDL